MRMAAARLTTAACTTALPGPVVAASIVPSCDLELAEAATAAAAADAAAIRDILLACSSASILYWLELGSLNSFKLILLELQLLLLLLMILLLLLALLLLLLWLLFSFSLNP